ncbi:phosphotriesterase family protein [Streptomyces sp. CA-142005]|uniref:phosphotriesterase family protein n=1 Tax=Streptomyces sp. CA-142005 TaxID=3240052 RepID=UPI003D921203
MTEVWTVRGPVDAGELGNVLVHEHVVVVGEEFRQNYADWDEQAVVDAAVAQLTELKGLGIDTILDPTVLGLGRYIPRIQKIAARTDLNIVPATGLYTYNDVPFQFHNTGPGLMFDMPDPLVDLFVKDLTEGIADTGVRAAFLKRAIEEPGLTPGVERVMRAVGRGSVRTGAPITVYTNAHTESGLVAQRVLAEEGVDLTRVVIGHAGDSTDLDHLMRLADAGSFLGMDRFGVEAVLSTEERVDTIVELVRRGYTDRIIISHDAACHIDWFGAVDRAALAPRWNFRHISEDVLQALLAKGVSKDDVDTILRVDPRRYFEG